MATRPSEEKGTVTSIEIVGSEIDKIEVKISYKIIELFSGGLYSSPNKAFEELVCNSYDAFADTVCVSVPYDFDSANPHIWICDNGEGMDSEELKVLWKIGTSPKRTRERDAKRLQIGRFGIGKLATYALARKLTHVSKKNGRYVATTMDYGRISEETDRLDLLERSISESDAKRALEPYIYTFDGKYKVKFKMFGEGASPSWTFALLTDLKPKAKEIEEGRLRWVLETALPLSPGFNLYYNGEELESSKLNIPIMKSWIFGENDPTCERVGATPRFEGSDYYIDFPKLKGIRGRIDLYEDSLDKGKAANVGRSHGIFLMVRSRLININDPLLGMTAFSHGPFNKSRIIVHADDLDGDITSTRESIRDGPALSELKNYIQKKFDNEVRKFYFDEEDKKVRVTSISYRLTQTSLTLSKTPLYRFALKFYNNEILNPLLIQKPSLGAKVSLLTELKKELAENESMIKITEWMALGISDPIAKFDIENGVVKINLLHPFVANYSDIQKSRMPLEFIAITEVLTEAHLYELGLDETDVNDIMRSRDNTLRQLSLSDRQGVPLVAQILKDSVSSTSGMEEAVYGALLALGFEVSQISGNGQPDGKAEAILGWDDPSTTRNYSLTYDAKSTGGVRIQAATAKLSAIKRHQTSYNATYSLVVAVDYEGGTDPESAISKESEQQKVTVMRAADLVRLLLLMAPHQIGLDRLKDLFERCHSPLSVKEWIDGIEKEEVKSAPYKEVLEAIYDLQKNDIEPVDFSSLRMKLKEKLERSVTKREVISWINSLQVIIPGFVSVTGRQVNIQGHPDQLMKEVHRAIQRVPTDLQQKYYEALCIKDGFV